LDEVISRDEQRRLDEILKSLDKNDLELLRLRFAAELTYKQIGDVIGKTEAAAKMSFIRLIQRLRLIWEGKDE
jgi:RNA polymerase sigma factor (sigma-70 family)